MTHEPQYRELLLRILKIEKLYTGSAIMPLIKDVGNLIDFARRIQLEEAESVFVARTPSKTD